MPTTRKQKKARKSKGLEIMSDIENLDEMLGGNHSDREESVTVPLLGYLKVQVVTPLIMRKDHIWILERTDLAIVPTVIRIPLVQFLALSLLNYQVNSFRGSQEKWTRWIIVSVSRFKGQLMMPLALATTCCLRSRMPLRPDWDKGHKREGTFRPRHRNMIPRIAEMTKSSAISEVS